jgi:hypothetical protein
LSRAILLLEIRDGVQGLRVQLEAMPAVSAARQGFRMRPSITGARSMLIRTPPNGNFLPKAAFFLLSPNSTKSMTFMGLADMTGGELLPFPWFAQK